MSILTCLPDRVFLDCGVDAAGGQRLKPVGWMGSARRDLLAFPARPRAEIGHALYLAQIGRRHPGAKTLKGFGGGHAIEIVEDHDGDTYRAVYTVRFEEAVYVLHVFQKKSKSGAATPKHEIDVIRLRLMQLEQQMRERQR